MIRPGRILRWGLPVLLGAVGREGYAQEADDQTRPFSLFFTKVYLQTDAVYERERQTSGQPPSTFSSERLQIQPVVGVGMAGSVYHENLLKYDVNPELGMDWEQSRHSNGGDLNDARFLQRYHGTIEFLRQKPYASSIYGAKDVSYRDYDFFSRSRIDSERWVGRTGYSAGPLPVSVTVQHLDEIESETPRPGNFSEDALSADSRFLHRDGKGSAQFTYNREDATREDVGMLSHHTLHNGFSAFDNEAFGDRDWIRLNSMLNYNGVSESTLDTSTLQMQERLTLDHTPRFSSSYSYVGGVASEGLRDTTTHVGGAGVRHQLYENLTSDLGFRGGTSRSDSPDGSSDVVSYGVTLDEQYTRRLSTWGRVSLEGSVGVDHEDRTSEGMTMNILNEPHVMNEDQVVLLASPMIDPTSIRVTDMSGSTIYVQDLDYSVIQHGAYTEIRRIPGGRIPKGSSVAVDYSANQQPSSSFTSYSDNVRFRIDFWNGLLGFYGRWSSVSYDGGENLMLRTIDDKTVGIDSSWRWLRAGVEYQTVEANSAPYNRFRIFEGVQFQIGDGTSLGVDVDQSWARYPDDNLSETVYGAILRLRQRFNSQFTWDIEGGVRKDETSTYNRQIATTRTELNWSVAKLSVKVGYAFNTQDYGTELSDRHIAYVRIRRTFR